MRTIVACGPGSIRDRWWQHIPHTVNLIRVQRWVSKPPAAAGIWIGGERVEYGETAPELQGEHRLGRHGPFDDVQPSLVEPRPAQCLDAGVIEFPFERGEASQGYRR